MKRYKSSKIILILILVFLTSLFSGCQSNKDIEEVSIAIPVPIEYAEENTDFLKGVNLMVDEISNINTPVKINVRVEDDKGIFSEAVKKAQEYIEDENVVVVIGHWFSEVCIPISSMYAKANKALVVPTVSTTALTDLKLNSVFQAIPSDRQIAEKMSKYAIQNDYKKVVVYYEDSLYGKEMNKVIDEYLKENGNVEIIDRVNEFSSKNDIKKSIKKWEALDYDAILIIDNVTSGAKVIEDLRNLDCNVPIIASDGMDSNLLANKLTKTSDIVVASTFKNNNEKESYAKFRDSYIEKYNEEPTVWAVQAYEVLNILVSGIVNHNVRTTEDMISYLSNIKDLGSIFGQVYFNENREIHGREVYLKKIVGNSLEIINED